MKLFIFLLAFIFPVQADDNAPWSRIILSGGKHLMMGGAPAELRQADTLNTLIEGDGKPGIALELATDIGGNSVYIGRPCQYLVGNHLNSCNQNSGLHIVTRGR